MRFSLKKNIFIRENAFQNTVHHILTILTRDPSVNFLKNLQMIFDVLGHSVLTTWEFDFYFPRNDLDINNVIHTISICNSRVYGLGPVYT